MTKNESKNARGIVEGLRHIKEAIERQKQTAPQIYPVTIEITEEDKARQIVENRYKGSQLSVAKWLNFITAIGTSAALIGLIYLYGSFQAAQQSAFAAKSAADTAHDALVLANRPWIKIKHKIISPLNFDFIGASGPQR